MKNNLLNSNIEELNEEVSIQAQQLTGTGAIKSLQINGQVLEMK